MPLEMEGARILMGSGRRSRGLSVIPPQYVAKSGLCNVSELESSRGGSIRIQHMTGALATSEGKSRFPKLDECAHFHYEHVEIGPLQVSLVDDDDLKPLSNEAEDGKWWSLSVTSQNKTWLIRRSYDNFRMLDQQLHRCIYDRKFSGLAELPAECIEEQENMHKLLSDYLTKFSVIAGSLINCGPVLNWLELDNRGRRLLVPDTDNCPINTPAVAAAYAVKRYSAQAPDEISFEVGDMISVIDMPPPEESIWWRGKRGFQVGFFPCECVAVIGDKVPRNLQISAQQSQPTKPVLRKHGKLIAFFRSFILSRPSRRRLKQSGILKERVFGCDLGEHLLNSGHEIPMVLKCCAEFIESHGIVDGIYRLSGVTSNIQKLRNAFDEDRVPGLYEDEAILQDIHSVASLLKMYFRELPNPLCTYQLYHQFVSAVQTSHGDDSRLLKMRDVVQKLPPPHYRTLEYLMRHLARVAEKGHETGMTPRNVAIVWAPNLLRCKELEVGGVAALQGVGVQAVVTEFLVCYTDLIFCDKLPNVSLPPQQVSCKKSRPKSLAISTPTKLLSLEEARTRALLQAAGKPEPDYIEVGGGPASLPAKYHTVIELPSGPRKRPGSKRSPLGWKLLFGKSGRSSQSRKETQQRKASTPTDFGLGVEKAVTESDIAQNRRRLRPAKSVESLTSSRNSATLEPMEPLEAGLSSPDDTLSPMLLRSTEGKTAGHNRSVSHESYFDQLQDHQEEERFESNLDLSEIQINFDLEESEMRIFSEDETLVSVGSGSLVSNSSPRILPGHKFNKSLANSVSKRLSYPKLARGEDSLSSSQSADPSPKKQKTSGEFPKSKLEEQLASSAGDIQFIDSVSPDQVLVEAEVHPIQSPSPVSSISQMSSSILPPSSPILPHIPHIRRRSSTTQIDNGGVSKSQENSKSNTSPESSQTNHASRRFSTLSNEVSPNSHLTSPSLAEATVSDNESFSLQSSELTTPETPLCGNYTPLLDLGESSVSDNTTPDFDVDADKTRKYSSETENLDKAMTEANLEFNRRKNIGKEYERFEEKILRTSSENICLDLKSKYENVASDVTMKARHENIKSKTFHQYENIPLRRQEMSSRVKPNVVLETSFDSKTKCDDASPDKRDSIVSIKYECISTESSSDSLININKTDENKLLLGIDQMDWLKTKEGETKVSNHSTLVSSETNSQDTSANLEEMMMNSEPKSVESNAECDKSSDNIPDFSFLFNECDSIENEDTSEPVIKTDVEKAIESTMTTNVDEASEVASLPSLETAIDESNDIEKALRTLVSSPKRRSESKPSPKKRTSPQKSNSSGNVRQLLSKFESNSECKSDSGNFKEKSESATQDGCLNSAATRRRNIEERPKTLERISTRRKTELRDSNLGKSKSGSQIDQKEMEVNAKIDTLLNYDLDLSDPQRRERIEKYKEKRRTYLREKYRSDSFKTDKTDDLGLKIVQKHVGRRGMDSSVVENAASRLPPFEKPARKHLPPKSQQPSSERRNPPFEKPARKNATSKIIDPKREEANNGKTLYRLACESKSSPDNTFSLQLSSVNKWKMEEKPSPVLLVSYSPKKKLMHCCESNAIGTSSTDSGISSDSSRTKSIDDAGPRDRLPTPTFCIRDVASLFERRDDSGSQVGTHKQYLSSV